MTGFEIYNLVTDLLQAIPPILVACYFMALDYGYYIVLVNLQLLHDAASFLRPHPPIKVTTNVKGKGIVADLYRSVGDAIEDIGTNIELDE